MAVAALHCLRPLRRGAERLELDQRVDREAPVADAIEAGDEGRSDVERLELNQLVGGEIAIAGANKTANPFGRDAKA